MVTTECLNSSEYNKKESDGFVRDVANFECWHVRLQFSIDYRYTVAKFRKVIRDLYALFVSCGKIDKFSVLMGGISANFIQLRFIETRVLCWMMSFML